MQIGGAFGALIGGIGRIVIRNYERNDKNHAHGEMPSPYTLITVKNISMFFSGVIFILFIMLQSKIKPDLLRQRTFLFSKLISILLIIALVLVFTQFSHFKIPPGFQPISTIIN
jgi:ethanolamine transporter EutH